jgi:hypothetical protein
MTAHVAGDPPRPVRGDRCLTPWEAVDAAEESRWRADAEARERRLEQRTAALAPAWQAEQAAERKAQGRGAFAGGARTR